MDRIDVSNGRMRFIHGWIIVIVRRAIASHVQANAGGGDIRDIHGVRRQSRRVQSADRRLAWLEPFVARADTRAVADAPALQAAA